MENYPDEFTKLALSRAADALISHNLICQKTDIATYAREQSAQMNEDDSARRATTSRGRGRGRGRGLGRGRGRGGMSRSVTNEGEAEWKDGGVKRKGLSIGDQILEMQAKKLKAE